MTGLAAIGYDLRQKTEDRRQKTEVLEVRPRLVIQCQTVTIQRVIAEVFYRQSFCYEDPR
ncbi:hypothetical protein BCS98_05210 [Vibrio breoganii]|nr:hypothetical protein BCS98_05210 [Vibrio breoganii]